MTTHKDQPRARAVGEAEAAGKRAFAARASATAAPRPAVASVRDVEAAAADKLQVPAVALRTPKVSWWATANDNQLAQWMDELAYWVEWLVATYELNHNFVPACWTLHPALVQELWALQCLHVLNHTGGAGTSALRGFVPSRPKLSFSCCSRCCSRALGTGERCPGRALAGGRGHPRTRPRCAKSMAHSCAK